MAIPVDDRVQIPISSSGMETSATHVFLNGTMWEVFLRFKSIHIKEYEGRTFKRVITRVSQFYTSRALNPDRTYSTSKFWIWVVHDDYTLKLYTIEPFVSTFPVTHSVNEVETDVANIRVDIQENVTPRVFILKNTLPKTFKLNIYDSMDQPAVYTLDMTWDAARLDDYSIFENPLNLNMQVGSTATSSPSNLYLEDYTYDPPILSLVGSTDPANGVVNASWTSVVDADNYVLERDTTELFSDPTIVYSGSNTSFQDQITVADTYYYRVKAQIVDAEVETDWSSIEDITVYILLPPENLIAIQVLVYPEGDVEVNWDAVSGADEYILERSEDEFFSTFQVVYTGSDLNFTDHVLETRLYYYRVKAHTF